MYVYMCDAVIGSFLQVIYLTLITTKKGWRVRRLGG